ncbi:MAG TPA: aminotransferase class I/II-fold pyridoxal phosphate-dependent enzyme, partial [Candidatus Saccharimonas sp.]|nr:aminotransferase class I/II-fold pyridoxal phosphate-dependent enzyme [Candidatus Saccharimonas sp.]
MNQLVRLTRHEAARQRDTLNLIASENYPSPSTLALLGSVWSNKYAEGQPGKRYYAGNVYADELESFVQAKALAIFDSTGEYGANVQVLSGSPANATVFLAALAAGDTVMSLNLANGGHLSHLHATSNYLKFFRLINYDVVATAHGYEIDQADYQAKLTEHQPKLVIIGFSAYPRAYQFEPLIKLAHRHGALVLADIAHIAGLVAAGLHDSPFKPGAAGADYVSMTTHKTLRGPRGALLFAKHQHLAELNRTVFPGTSGGPHLHQIAATGQALLEVLGEDQYPDRRPFPEYAKAIISTCRALEAGLNDGGLAAISPTQTHLTLTQLPPELDSLDVQRRLESLGLILNRNLIPFDAKTAW